MALRTVPGLKKGRTEAREKPEIAPVSDADVEATLPELATTTADMVRIQRLCGCRPGELLAMTVEAIDRTDPQCWVFRPDHHKTEHHGKGRTIFLGPKAIDLLRMHLVAAGTGRIFPILRDGYRQAIVRTCERAQIAQWTPNRLRHAAATEFRSKFGLEAAQVLLGHSKADTTQVYAERDLKKAADVARKIG
jgi:integrase